MQAQPVTLLQMMGCVVYARRLAMVLADSHAVRSNLSHAQSRTMVPFPTPSLQQNGLDLWRGMHQGLTEVRTTPGCAMEVDSSVSRVMSSCRMSACSSTLMATCNCNQKSQSNRFTANYRILAMTAHMLHRCKQTQQLCYEAPRKTPTIALFHRPLYTQPAGAAAQQVVKM